MAKNSVIFRVVLYTILSLFFLTYPGQNVFLTQAAIDYAPFTVSKSLRFQPQPLPVTETFFTPEFFSAQSYLVMDLDSFTPVAGYQIRKEMFPASTVKLATALVSLRHFPLKQTLRVGKVIDEELKMGLVAGEKISVLNLLYGTLVYSANDASYTLAENFPGGVTQFVAQMNQLAATLNMHDTHFSNPIGFDNRNQYTTAYDLAILAKEFVSEPLLVNITSTKTITVADVDFVRFHYLTNINELLGEIPHLGGLKTGTTEAAGQNLIAFYKFGTHPLLIVVLNSKDRFGDTRQLINYINSSLRYAPII